MFLDRTAILDCSSNLLLVLCRFQLNGDLNCLVWINDVQGFLYSLNRNLDRCCIHTAGMSAYVSRKTKGCRYDYL